MRYHRTGKSYSRWASKPGGTGRLLAAIVVGVALAIGMTQERILPGQNHWIFQVTHLVVALVAVGLGEMLAGGVRRWRERTPNGTQSAASGNRIVLARVYTYESE